MLVAEDMINLLLEDEHPDSNTDSNDDLDFGMVLEFCANDGTTKPIRELPCSDGQKRVLSFDD